MATINHSAGADIIVPSNNGTTYRGLAGDDTYIISNSIAANGAITIVDTSGANKIQLVDGLSIASSAFAADAVQLTLSNGAVVTINGASNFTYDVGGNATSGTTGTSNTLAAFAASMGVATLPASGSTAGSSDVTVSGSAVSSSASPTYTLTKSATSVDEGSAVTFTITSSSAVTADTAFSWTVIGSDNGATVDKATSADLDAQSGSATIASGATSTTFSVTALADSAGEGVEGIKVSVFDPNSATVGSHTVLINNTGAAASAQAFTGTTSYDAFTGGTGNDTFTFTVNDSLDNTDIIDGGAGTDTLVANLDASGNVTRTPNAENIEILKVKNTDSSGGTDTLTYDLINTASTFTTLWNDNSADAVSLTNLQEIPGLVKLSLAVGTTTVDFELTALGGTADTLNVEILGTSSTTLALTGGSALTAQTIETVSIKSDSVANTLADLQTTGVGATSLVTTGAKQLTITAAIDSEIVTIDASGMTGTAGLALAAAPGTAVGVTATGSGGADTLYGSAGLDNISSGGGNDTINLGTVVATDTVDGGAGTDTVVATASVTSDTVFAGQSNVETLSLSGAVNATLTATTATFDTVKDDGSNNNTITIDTSYGGSAITVDITGDANAGDTITNSSAATLTILAGTADLNGASATTITATATNLGDTLSLQPDGAGDLGTNGGNNQITGFDSIVIRDSVLGNSATTLDLGDYATALTIDASALDAADATLTITGTNVSKSMTYTGGAGVDAFTGGAVGDNITGGAGNDILAGTAGNNTIDGGAGIDTISLGTGIDHVQGGAGNDIITGAAQIKADDTIDGGDGTDTLTHTGAIAFSTILGGLSNVEVLAPQGAIAVTLQSPIAGLSSISLTEAGNQVVTFATGYTGAMTVSLAGDSNDNQDSVINTAGIPLTVTGYGLDFDSDTTITGGAGTDTITMTNTASFSAILTNVTGVETITVNDFTLNADANITTGAANLSALTIDTSSLDAGENTTIDASARVVATTITAGNGTNNLQGGTVNDVITGGSGVDTIDGQENSATLGADSIHGGAGNDIINVSTAESEFSNSSTTALVTDTVDGGAGTDTLAFGATATLTGVELANIHNIESLTLQDTSTITLTNTFLTNNPGVAVTLGAGTVSADTTGTTVNLSENVTFITTSGNINFTSGTGDDTFITSAAVLDASDTIAMGTGTDTITVRNNTSLIDGTGNAATVVLSGVTGVENVTVQDLADTDTAGNVTISTAAGYVGTSITIDGTALDYDSVTPANSEVLTVDLSANAATETATILGGDGLDVLTGGAGADSISGAGSNDSVTGGGGADTITGGVGVDTLEGSGGLDNIDGGAGNDIIKITTYADFQTTGGTETVDGGAGTDTLSLAQAAAPTITAPELSTVSNIEVIDATSTIANNTTTLTLSQAFMDNNGSAILIDGNETGNSGGNHVINASTVSTGVVTFQTEGNTTGKNDTFYGGGGNDILVVGTTLQTSTAPVEWEAADVFDGNGGTDTIQINNRGNASNAGSGAAKLIIDFDAVTEVENAIVQDADGATTAADYIKVELAASVTAANTPLTFEVDASAITDADDDLTFNYDADTSAVTNSALTTRFTVKGGAGDDTIYGAAGSDTITTGNGANVVVTGNSTTVGGGAAGDNVTGGTGIDNVTGGTGADTITAAGGADIIAGGAGADVIDGGTGADVITGGTGGDNITGGAGNDTFKYSATHSAGATKDTITDFAATSAAGVAGDKLEISLTLAAGGVTFTETDRGDVASTAEAPGNLGGVAGDFVFNDGTAEFMLDVNGDGNINVNDLVIGLTGETAFAEADVVFNITGGSGNDIITLGANDDTVGGAAGVDTITTGAGADSISAGAGDDIIVAGAGNDTIADSADNDTMTGGAGADILTVTTGTNIIKWSSGDGAAATAVTGFDVIVGLTEGTDVMSFDESALINGALGNKAIAVVEASSAVDLNTGDNIGVFVIDATVTVADGLTSAASTLAGIAQNETADDAFIFIVDNDTDTFIIHWDDRVANGGDGGGDIDAAELTILAKFAGEADAHNAGYQATGDFTLY